MSRNVYWLSSCLFFQSLCLYALTFCKGRGRETRREASKDACSIKEASATVLPINVIFLSTIEESGKAGSLKGGLSSPSLEIMNFWLEGGIKRLSATSSERSEIVASLEKERV